MDLFTSDHTFVNADLATIYGLPTPAKEFDRVSFPAGSERAGLLGQTLFLALTAKPQTGRSRKSLPLRESFLWGRGIMTPSVPPTFRGQRDLAR